MAATRPRLRGRSRLDPRARPALAFLAQAAGAAGRMTRVRTIQRRECSVGDDWPNPIPPLLRRVYNAPAAHDHPSARPPRARKSGVEGKRGAVRVDPGGSVTIKKKKTKE